MFNVDKKIGSGPDRPSLHLQILGDLPCIRRMSHSTRIRFRGGLLPRESSRHERAMQNICVESQYSSVFDSSGTKDQTLFMVSAIILLYINLDRIFNCFSFGALDLGLSASRVNVLTARIRWIFTLNRA